ncbi:hypothetical protein K6R05_07655 [Pantoea alfalfae]|uniref:hypothetical protein n=1 Tax=Pantoea alfalfae TaxID=3074822 RepID=UPI001CA42238|nr:hypothetical protein [Pantoea alfalfae]QZX97066.1 hypothetical protein K6R05_07655 [Pantoea alfalfae]
MSDAIKEIAGILKESLVTPVQEAFVYRAKNPFFGTLIISWMFYNWDKVAYFCLSKRDVLERINFIRTKIPDNSIIFGHSISHTHSFWFPIVWSVLLTVTYPFFTYCGMYIHRRITSKIESINSHKERTRLILQRELMIQIAKNESARAKQLATDEAELEETKERTITAKFNIESLKEQRNTLNSQVDTLQEQKRTLEILLVETNDSVKRANNNLGLLTERYVSFGDLEEKYLLMETELNNLKDSINTRQNPAFAKTVDRGQLEGLPASAEIAAKIMSSFTG